MKLLHFVSFTSFLCLLKSSSVSAQINSGKDEQRFADVVSAEYTKERDDLKTGISKSEFRRTIFPNLGFGDNIAFGYTETFENKSTRESILRLSKKGNTFIVGYYQLINGGKLANNQTLTTKQIQYLGAQCDKNYTLQGSTYVGKYPVCASTTLALLTVLDSTVNCTHNTVTAPGNKMMILVTSKRIYPLFNGTYPVCPC